VRREGKLDISDYRKPGFFERTDIVEIICWVAGVASSLVFAFSPVMWSQSTIVEVYTLNAFFLMHVDLNMSDNPDLNNLNPMGWKNNLK
jgi:hypothetical protein